MSVATAVWLIPPEVSGNRGTLFFSSAFCGAIGVVKTSGRKPTIASFELAPCSKTCVLLAGGARAWALPASLCGSLTITWFHESLPEFFGWTWQFWADRVGGKKSGCLFDGILGGWLVARGGARGGLPPEQALA